MYLELLQLASPEAVLTITALILLALQALRPTWRSALPLIAGFGTVAAILTVFLLPTDANNANGMLVVSPLSSLAKIICLFLSLFTVLFARGSTFTKHLGEYLALILLATIGLMILVSTDQLLMIFIGLELTGLSLYIISAFDKNSRPGIEGGMKYFLFGSVASAFTLFGLSLVYGMTGSTHLPEIARMLVLIEASSSTEAYFPPLLAAGLVMTVAGLAFKIAAAPMHLWAPDTYQAAPVPSAAFIASASKVAAFFVLGRLLIEGLSPVAGSADFQAATAGWAPALAVIAALSIITGNLVALAQKNLRRLLAYSAIAHAGYTLLGILAGTPAGFSATLFYTTVYGITILGTFGIIDVVKRHTGRDDIAAFANLRHRSPLLAAYLAIFLLSLAGLPPLVGFFGKFYLFAAAFAAGENNGLLWLILLALAGSLVSLYYYLSVLKTALVDTSDASDATPDAQDLPTDKIPLPPLHQILLTILAALTLGLALFPNALLDAIRGAI